MSVKSLFSIGVVLALCSLQAQAAQQEWHIINDKNQLVELFTDSTASTVLASGDKAIAKYHKDGTGSLDAWGKTFARRWQVKNQQVCIEIDSNWQCFVLAQNSTNKTLYRATNAYSKEQITFTLIANEIAIAEPSIKTNKGGAATPSADEIAKELANPNTPLATLNLKYQYRTFDGDLPNASEQSSHTMLFQPSFPFKLDNGDMVLFRPAVPILFDQPVMTQGGWQGETALGDISFDLAYGKTSKSGLITAYGVVASLPTASDDAVGSNKFSAGPEFLIAKMGKNYILGAYPNHMWDIAGSGNADISTTSSQFFATWLPGGGWSLGTTPIMSYDHINSQATVPVNFTVGKTMIFNNRPWKFSFEANYYIEKADPFGPDWMIGFSVGPVVKNVLADLF